MQEANAECNAMGVYCNVNGVDMVCQKMKEIANILVLGSGFSVSCCHYSKQKEISQSAVHSFSRFAVAITS
mgnify:CR=1 FL=1